MATSSDPVYVLPGDEIDPALIPSHPKKALRLGPGLRHVAPNDLLPTLAGQLVTDRQKNLIRVETSEGRVRHVPHTETVPRERSVKHLLTFIPCAVRSSCW